MWKTVILVPVFFGSGWFAYPYLLSYAASAIPNGVTVSSVDQLFIDRLVSSLPFMLIGLSVSIGTPAWGTRRQSLLSFSLRFGALTILGAMAVLGWTQVLHDRFVSLTQAALISPAIPFSISLSDLPMYQIGLFACVCVLVAAVLIRAFSMRRAGTSEDN